MLLTIPEICLPFIPRSASIGDQEIRETETESFSQNQSRMYPSQMFVGILLGLSHPVEQISFAL